MRLTRIERDILAYIRVQIKFLSQEQVYAKRYLRGTKTPPRDPRVFNETQGKFHSRAHRISGLHNLSLEIRGKEQTHQHGNLHDSAYRFITGLWHLERAKRFSKELQRTA